MRIRSTHIRVIDAALNLHNVLAISSFDVCYLFGWVVTNVALNLLSLSRHSKRMHLG